jgi:arabinofuranosyltransferase
LGLVFLAVVIKTAWVGDDAYISFRSLEQLYAGNGPNWNALERIQVYTSPLWFWLLAAMRGISTNVYLNAIAISLIIDIGLIVYCLRQRTGFLYASLLLIPLMLSNSFMDYTTSGLENPLIYLLLAVFIVNCYKAYTTQSKNCWMPILLTSACLLVTRHDLLLVIVFPLLFLFVFNPLSLSWPEKIKGVFLILLPLGLWSLFSLLYYGMPFPNTAYAKLHLDIPREQLLKQGLTYFWIGIKYDVISIAIIISGWLYLTTRMRDKFAISIALSLLLGVVYVVWIGGDFMSGRFYSHLVFMALLASLLTLSQPWFNLKKNAVVISASVIVMGALYGFFYPHTPVNGELVYEKTLVRKGISDERGLYSPQMSIWQYLKNDASYRCRSTFGQYPVAEPYAVWVAIGIDGYSAGKDSIIFDNPALASVFLARMPRGIAWAPGHTWHPLPDGFPESYIAQKPLMKDAALNQYFSVVSSITQSDTLFSWERMKIILLFNMGHYEHLVRESNLWFPPAADTFFQGWDSP